jgi:hypothetical protein
VRPMAMRHAVANRLAMSSDDEPILRIGHGFDIHRLVEGNRLVIGTFVVYRLDLPAMLRIM